MRSAISTVKRILGRYPRVCAEVVVVPCLPLPHGEREALLRRPHGKPTSLVGQGSVHEGVGVGHHLEAWKSAMVEIGSWVGESPVLWAGAAKQALRRAEHPQATVADAIAIVCIDSGDSTPAWPRTRASSA
jgi:hypothetical protein